MRAEDLSPGQNGKLAKYLDLLFKYNEKTNLTSFGSREEALQKGVFPSLLGADLLLGVGTVIDIGSGSGIPAVPLAICVKAERLILLEPARLKAFFLRECAASLELPIQVVEQTGEDYLSRLDEKADGMTMRGVRMRPRLMKLIRGGLKAGAPFLLWSGGESGAQYGAKLERAGFAVSRRETGSWGLFIAGVPCGTLSTK